MTTYVVACRTEWGLKAFAQRRSRLPGRWVVFTDKADLTLDTVKALQPRYVFFPHWSWIVPPSITLAYECVCFHMTDVPYGRGGSPLQNLIATGHVDTMLTALRMDEGTDTGPVYMKVPMSLSGSAADIYARAADLSFDLLERIVAEEPEPVPQQGVPVPFQRRKPADSALTGKETLTQLHDAILMVDADGYPRAFLDLGHLRLTFSDAQLSGDSLRARVRIENKAAPND